MRLSRQQIYALLGSCFSAKYRSFRPRFATRSAQWNEPLELSRMNLGIKKNGTTNSMQMKLVQDAAPFLWLWIQKMILPSWKKNGIDPAKSIQKLCLWHLYNVRHVCDICDGFDSSLISLQMPRFDKAKQIVSWKGVVHLMVQKQGYAPSHEIHGFATGWSNKISKANICHPTSRCTCWIVFFLPLLLSCQVNSIVSHLDHSILCFTAICLAGSVWVGQSEGLAWSIHQFCQPQKFMVAITSQGLFQACHLAPQKAWGTLMITPMVANTDRILQVTLRRWKNCIIQPLLKHTLETSECSHEIHTLRSRHQPVPSLGPPKARYWKKNSSCWNNSKGPRC